MLREDWAVLCCAEAVGRAFVEATRITCAHVGDLAWPELVGCLGIVIIYLVVILRDSGRVLFGLVCSRIEVEADLISQL